MQGMSMNEFYERIMYLHEAEFIYDKATYIIQSVADDEKAWLVIDCVDTSERLSRYEIPMHGAIPKPVIDAVLSKKCFNGKSFLEIEHEITVTVIY